jgi:hypothetical protein
MGAIMARGLSDNQKAVLDLFKLSPVLEVKDLVPRVFTQETHCHRALRGMVKRGLLNTGFRPLKAGKYKRGHRPTKLYFLVNK